MKERRPNPRSPEAQAYQRWYKTAAWLKARAEQLDREPLCCMCTELGKITAATVVNHRKPHRGDWALFIDRTNHQSVCKPHHDGPIQSFERTGRMRGCGPDGLPLDPSHHWKS